MLQANWVLTKGVHEDVEPILDEIARQGMKATLLPHSFGNTFTEFPETEPVIACGAINYIQTMQRSCRWVPGSFANFKNLDCLTYYAYFGQWLVNQKYTILPLTEAIRRHAELEQLYGRMFIRPTTGWKPFTGQEFYIQDFVKHQDHFGKPELPVLVAPYRQIRQEFRLFCDSEVIAGSQYRNSEGEIEYVPVPEEHPCIKYVNEILAKVRWQPDAIFVVDVGVLDDGSFGIIELNSFSCSGWYAASPKEIVARANYWAVREWEDLYSVNQN